MINGDLLLEIVCPSRFGGIGEAGRNLGIVNIFNCIIQISNYKFPNYINMKYNCFLPLLISLAVIILSEIFFFWPQMIYVILVLAVLLFLFTLRQFKQASLKKEKWWNFLILPSCFYVGLIVFSSLIPNKLLVQLLFIFNIVFLYFYFRSLYYYLIKPDFYQDQSLENFSSYGNFLAFYFIASAIYGLQAFLNIPVWLLVLVMLVVIGLIVYQIIWINKINIHVGLFYILLACLILVELAWSVTFLPLSFYILGLILSICYYMLIGLIRYYLLNRLDKKIIKLYLIFGFSSIFMVLLTARWM